MSKTIIRKKEKTHKLLINTAIDLFIRKRSSNVSLDEVADTADVARRTFYYHFNNKEQLILEIIKPILIDGLNYLDKILLLEKLTIDEITGLCLYLWNRYGLSLNLLYTVDFEDFNSLKELHKKYHKKYIEVFNRISDFPEDLQDYKMDIAALIFRCFVSILAKVDKMANSELRFVNCIRSMIEGMALTSN